MNGAASAGPPATKGEPPLTTRDGKSRDFAAYEEMDLGRSGPGAPGVRQTRRRGEGHAHPAQCPEACSDTPGARQWVSAFAGRGGSGMLGRADFEWMLNREGIMAWRIFA
jgi:hypothetical protein